MQRDRYRDRSRGLAGGSPFACQPALPCPDRCGLACLEARDLARAACMLACLHGGSVRAAQRWHTAARVRKGKARSLASPCGMVPW